jgi:hypothetical protein
VYGGLIRIGTFTVSLRIVAKRVSFLEIHTPPDDFMFHLWCLVLAFQWFHPDLINVSPFAGQGNHVTTVGKTSMLNSAETRWHSTLTKTT